jgi:hypothetical protein
LDVVIFSNTGEWTQVSHKVGKRSTSWATPQP